jgi:hypothetical protein
MIMEFFCDIDGFKEQMKIYYILKSSLFDHHWQCKVVQSPNTY